ncbi:MAG: hypothetical protein JWN34_2299 [Bryobacterales bacterium]|jgi:hypothetical protein|nr:hypothetical protein [Bryobacterales bacterium]
MIQRWFEPSYCTFQRFQPPLEPANIKRFYPCSIEGRTLEELSEHVRLMAEDGLIEVHKGGTARGWEWHPTRVTLAGHRYLAAIKDDTFYATIKEMAEKTFGTISVETIKAAIPMVFSAIAKHASDASS